MKIPSIYIIYNIIYIYIYFSWFKAMWERESHGQQDRKTLGWPLPRHRPCVAARYQSYTNLPRFLRRATRCGLLGIFPFFSELPSTCVLKTMVSCSKNILNQSMNLLIEGSGRVTFGGYRCVILIVTMWEFNILIAPIGDPMTYTSIPNSL